MTVGELIPLPKVALEMTCKLGGGNLQCRYLGASGNQQYCLKVRPYEKNLIDKEIEILVARCTKVGKEFTLPLGDGCDGFLPSEHHEAT